ncbi:hypothetical protein FV222_22850 [Methylobacterium sp. WL103]|nr:hypothetical protein FV222_22850 [Methylobacterium sp. WL103]
MQPRSERRSRSGGEGGPTEEPPSARPPHRRLPPRFADDKVGKALSPRAGRGDARTANRQTARAGGRPEALDPGLASGAPG